MASNAISDITDKALVCQVCLEDFKQPKILPCFHTCCQPCLERLLATDPVGKLSCPTCKQDVQLPLRGVRGLKSNLRVCRLRNNRRHEPEEKTFKARETANRFEDHHHLNINSSQTHTQVRPKVVFGRLYSGGTRLEHRKTFGELGTRDGQFNVPFPVVCTEGDIVVADYGNSRLQFLSKDGSFKRKVNLRFDPLDVSVLSQDELLVTGDGHMIHVLDKRGREVRAMQVTGAAADTYKTTRGIAVDGLGRVIVTIGHQVFVLRPNGDVMLKFGGRGQSQQHLGSNLRVAVSSSNQIIISDFGNHCLKIFDPSGSHLFTSGLRGSGPGQLNWPFSVITDSEDNIIVVDSRNCRVSLFSRDGTFVRHVLTKERHRLVEPKGLALTHDGHLVVSDNHSLKMFQ